MAEEDKQEFLLGIDDTQENRDFFLGKLPERNPKNPSKFKNWWEREYREDSNPFNFLGL